MDAILEVGHTVFIKQEFIESDESSAFQRESTDLASQPVKIESRCPYFHNAGSPGQSQTNSSITPVNVLTRIKTEEYLKESHSVDSSDIRTEIKLEGPEQLFKYENVRETNGRGDNAEVDFFSPVDPLSTTNGDDGADLQISAGNINDQNLAFRKKEIKRHKRLQKSFICSHCLLALSSRKSLLQHLKRHSGEKPFTCGDCSASFYEKNRLHSHMRRHTGEKPFSCSHCSTSFILKGHLNRHLKIHIGGKPFGCSHCSASFTHKHHLKGHMRTHTGERPFNCSYCSASFAQTSTLNRHILTHTGEKALSCSHCSTSFAHENVLKRHIQTHTTEKPFSCSHCLISFSLKSDLNRHIKIHIGEKPFSCSHCSASFTDKHHLKEHMRKHNGEKSLIYTVPPPGLLLKLIKINTSESTSTGNHSTAFFAVPL